ncbi:MAG: molybdenum cofactor biosynthesis protein MoaE [Marinoscillum sp.]|jgi:molybdopterin synthase catalytic subunit
MNKKKVIKNIFIKGPITSDFIAKSIESHKTKKIIGAHELFLGQVRSDNIKGKEVVAIDFTAQEKMANKICHDIKESIFDNFPIYCIHIYHSLGKIKGGDVCVFVFVSGPHRSDIYGVLKLVLNEIKTKAPIFGKEIFNDESHRWKVNNNHD